MNNLKHDLKRLLHTFPDETSSLSVLSANVDEINLEFNFFDKCFQITGNISPDYPKSPSLWFCSIEDTFICEVLAKMSSANSSNFGILNQIEFMVKEFCRGYNFPVPSNLHLLSTNNSDVNVNTVGSLISMESSSNHVPNADIDDSSNISEADDTGFEDDEENGMAENVAFEREYEGLSKDVAKNLEKIRNKTGQDTKSGIISGSTQSNDRLMKELMDLYKSQSFKNQFFSVELVNDCLYEWNVKLFKFDRDSHIFKDLLKYKILEHHRDHLLLHFMFNNCYPFEPPFVRIVYPVIKNGYVLSGGAICMELLTADGWMPAYSVEAVVMQISATLSKGKAKIDFESSENVYSLAKAQLAYRSLVGMHKRNGWFTPPKSEG